MAPSCQDDDACLDEVLDIDEAKRRFALRQDQIRKISREVAARLEVETQLQERSTKR